MTYVRSLDKHGDHWQKLETQAEIARTLGYRTANACEELQTRVNEVGRLLTGLRAWSAKA